MRLTEHLALEEIRPSIGSVGDAYDNALMESVSGLTRPSAPPAGGPCACLAPVLAVGAVCFRTPSLTTGPTRPIVDVEYATAGWVD